MHLFYFTKSFYKYKNKFIIKNYSKFPYFNIKISMIYNDFPTMSDDEYNLINEHYKNSTDFNRQDYLIKISAKLNELESLTCCFSKEFNNKIINKINFTNSVLLKQKNNLQALFNLEIASKNSFSNFNIFDYIKNLLQLINLFTNWSLNETKAYYKEIAKNSANELNKNLEDILFCLETVNTKFFKFM